MPECGVPSRGSFRPITGFFPTAVIPHPPIVAANSPPLGNPVHLPARLPWGSADCLPTLESNQRKPGPDRARFADLADLVIPQRLPRGGNLDGPHHSSLYLPPLCGGGVGDHQQLIVGHGNVRAVVDLCRHHVAGGGHRHRGHLCAAETNRHDFGNLLRSLDRRAFELRPMDRDLAADGTVIQRAGMRLVIALVLCYTCTSVLLQTKDDFRFVIPYVEFVREVKGFKPLVLDTSVVIDGRIADLVGTGVFDNQLIMPRFALSELQAIADSSDKLRRTRGRRGLDVLNRLRADENVDLTIFDRELPELAGQTVDLKLVLLAKHLEGKVVTGDFNLNKVAKLHNVPVINLNEISNSLRPVFLPDETFNIKIIKPGEGPEQGIGYLDDGTMVVVEGARNRIGQDLDVKVTSTLQTNAGKMIFCKYEGR